LETRKKVTELKIEGTATAGTVSAININYFVFVLLLFLTGNQNED
jgi:hypothetical protein